MLPQSLLHPVHAAGRFLQARPWPQGPLGRLGGQAAVTALQPMAVMLTAALRRLARQRPDVFERLGPARQARILICPAGLPMAFLVRPDGAAGAVQVVRAAAVTPCEARIEAPLDLLLGLMQGSEDGDAAFFASELWIEGETVVVLSLRNAIEEAEMNLTDLLPRPPLPELPPLPRLPRGPWRSAMSGRRS
ncbi:SCP2 domain-containing protein [Maricaulis sp.]|uniref:SCP2 domain-containing protein n=1 Tax=Maricaulis sp. TaxID=1486257 RepID=UPI003A9354AC